MPELFDVHPGHDGGPVRIEAPSPRPRDRATVQANHAANAARCRKSFDQLIAEYLETLVSNAEKRDGRGAWSTPFRFERDPALVLAECRSVAAFVYRRKRRHPAADTCRRRGVAQAEALGLDLSNINGSGLYRARRAPSP